MGTMATGLPEKAFQKVSDKRDATTSLLQLLWRNRLIQATRTSALLLSRYAGFEQFAPEEHTPACYLWTVLSQKEIRSGNVTQAEFERVVSAMPALRYLITSGLQPLVWNPANETLHSFMQQHRYIIAADTRVAVICGKTLLDAVTAYAEQT